MVWSEIINNKHANLPLKRIRQSRSNNKGRLLQFSIQKQEYLNFISNDYLGLSYHLALKNAIISGTENYGAGSTGAASLSGYSQEQELLSQELANWLKCEACLICNSGYTLNWGLYQPLVTSQVTAWLDENCHASHIDGILFSRAKFRQFGKHSINDIQMAINNDVNRLHLIVSEGIFSMDGSSTHLDKLIQLRKKFPDQVLLILDDAHGLGTTGVNAWGQLGMLGHSPNDVDLLIGTLGKTFGSHGAFIAGKETIINYLQQSIRSQIYTTSLPPAIHAASRAALAIITSKEGYKLRQQLQANIELFCQLAQQYQLKLLHGSDNSSPIQLITGYSIVELENADIELKQSGIRLSLIQYPTVPKQTPRLRVSISAMHNKSDIEYLCQQLGKILNAAS